MSRLLAAGAAVLTLAAAAWAAVGDTTGWSAFIRLPDDSAVAPPQRADACRRLAERATIEQDYTTAAARYRQAWTLSASADDCLRWAVAEGRGGNAATAESLLAPLRAAPATSRAAAYCQGMLCFGRREYEPALNHYSAALQAPDTAAWFAPAMAGRALCADRLGYVSLAGQYRREFERRFPGALEAALFAGGFAPLAADTAGPFGGRPAEGGQRYTIQVGSYATVEGATRQQEKLLRQFDGVEVTAGSVEGKTYYRLRVGAFASAEQAEAWARQRLVPANIDYKVLKQ